MRCQRCNKETDNFTGSIFNTELICMECAEKERDHPDYEKARAVEADEVRKGNYNFEGIGLPDDLTSTLKMNYTNFICTYFLYNARPMLGEIDMFFSTWVADSLIKAVNVDKMRICDLIKKHDLGNYIARHRKYYELLNKQGIVDDLIKYLQGKGETIVLK